MLPETTRWRAAAAAGTTRATRMTDLFRPPYRGRAVAAVGAALFVQLGLVATQTWAVYHPVRALGVAPLVATAVVMAGGAVGLAGFPLGGRLADRLGRRGTFVLGTVVSTAAFLAYYGVPLGPGATGACAAAFATAMLAANVAAVAFRAAVTESFPTSLRGTLQGWLTVAAALAGVAAHAGAARLVAAFGALGPAISVLAVVALGAVVAVLALPETAGLELETVAPETTAARHAGTPIAANRRDASASARSRAAASPHAFARPASSTRTNGT
jgi:MFS family permease